MSSKKFTLAAAHDIDEYRDKILRHDEFKHDDGITETLKLIFADTRKGGDGLKASFILKKLHPDCEFENVVYQDIKKINGRLREYYDDDTEDGGATDTARFRVINKKPGFILVDRNRPLNSGKTETPTHKEEAHRKENEVEDLGKVSQGIQYELDQLPLLSGLLETHTRQPKHVRGFPKEEREKYQEALKSFLSNPDNRYVLIVGQTVEKSYIDVITETVKSAARDPEKQFECYKLRYPGMLMNFDILEYPDREPSKEVLFGWGKYDDSPSGRDRVFRSSHKGLVGEFNEFHKLLRREESKLSRRISLAELSELAQDQTGKRVKTPVECYFIGDSETALKRVIDRMPRLVSLRDVHVRPEKEDYPKYAQELLDEFQAGLESFLSRHKDNKLLLIAGQRVEERYVKAIEDAAKKQIDNQVSARRLKYPGFLMNFAIFEYEGEHRGQTHEEVLFGWGHYPEWFRGSKGKVFLSTDSQLIGEFKAYYETLQRELSDEVPLKGLSETTLPPSPVWKPDQVECLFVGDNNAGLTYEIEQMPDLLEFRDVHIRPADSHRKYDEKILGDFQQAVKTFLGKDNKLKVIIGKNFEQEYLEALKLASDGQDKKVEFFSLRQPFLLMNFALLYYKQGPTQVLFGWGRYNRTAGEAVFRSFDHRLVGEFEKFYDALTAPALSDTVPVTRLLTRLSDNEPTPTERVTIAPDWSNEKVRGLLHKATPGSEVKILTTLFPDFPMMHTDVQELLERGVNVTIVMMNPDNAKLVEARFGKRKDYPPQKAKDEIIFQSDKFKELNTQSLPGKPGLAPRLQEQIGFWPAVKAHAEGVALV